MSKAYLTFAAMPVAFMVSNLAFGTNDLAAQ
jgi:hypothetical protein